MSDDVRWTPGASAPTMMLAARLHQAASSAPILTGPFLIKFHRGQSLKIAPQAAAASRGSRGFRCAGGE
jgi:hypothetical protein